MKEEATKRKTLIKGYYEFAGVVKVRRGMTLCLIT